MDTEKIKRILTAIESATVIMVDDDLREVVNSNEVTGDPENTILIISDEEIWGHECEFTEQALSDAVVVDHTITLENLDGMDVEICLYDMTPHRI